MEVKQPLVLDRRSRLALWLRVRRHEIGSDLAQRARRAGRLTLRDGISTFLDRAEHALGHRSRFVWREAAMLAEFHPARAPILAVLDDVDLAAGGEHRDAKAAQSVV